MAEKRHNPFPLLCLIGLLAGAEARAEYRVYQYFVKSRLELPYDRKSYLTTSTFDPVSFLAYHGGNDSIQIELLNTWMCKGHTGGQDLCPGPQENGGTQE